MAARTGQVSHNKMEQPNVSKSPLNIAETSSMDILDICLLFWIFFSLFIMIIIQIYLKLMEFSKQSRVRRREISDFSSTEARQGNSRRESKGGESAEWLAVLGAWWFITGVSRGLHVMTAWLDAVTEEANKYMAANTELRITNAKFGSETKPLQLSNITTDGANTDNLIIRTDVKISGLTLDVKVTRKKETNEDCDSESQFHILLSLHAPVKIIVSRFSNTAPANKACNAPLAVDDSTDANAVRINAAFSAEPNIRLEILPDSCMKNLDEAMIERILTEGISRASLTFYNPQDCTTSLSSSISNNCQTEANFRSTARSSVMYERSTGAAVAVSAAVTSNNATAIGRNSIAEAADKRPEAPGKAETVAADDGRTSELFEDGSSWDNWSEVGKRTSVLSDRSEAISQSLNGIQPPNRPIVSTNGIEDDRDERDIQGEVKPKEFSSPTDSASTASAKVITDGLEQNSEPAGSVIQINGSTDAPTKEEMPRKKGFASQLRRSFSAKSKKEERSRSAEKAKKETKLLVVDINIEDGGTLKPSQGGTLKSQVGDALRPSGGSTLKAAPSGECDGVNNTDAEQVTPVYAADENDNSLRKARANSLSSSFRNLFKKKKRNKSGQDGGVSAGGESRDSSFSRRTTTEREVLSDTGKTNGGLKEHSKVAKNK